MLEVVTSTAFTKNRQQFISYGAYFKYMYPVMFKYIIIIIAIMILILHNYHVDNLILYVN